SGCVHRLVGCDFDIQIRQPLPDVAHHVVESKTVRRKSPDGLRPLFLGAPKPAPTCGFVVSPGKDLAIQAATRGFFPLVGAWEAVRLESCRPQPPAIRI